MGLSVLVEAILRVPLEPAAAAAARRFGLCACTGSASHTGVAPQTSHAPHDFHLAVSPKYVQI
jgi:hypothetical protein